MKKIQQSKKLQILDGFSRMTNIEVDIVKSKEKDSDETDNLEYLNYQEISNISNLTRTIKIRETEKGTSYGVINCNEELYLVGPISITNKEFESDYNLNIQDSNKNKKKVKQEIPSISRTNFEYYLLVLFSSLTQEDVNDIVFEYLEGKTTTSNMNFCASSEEERLNVCMEYINDNIEKSLSLKSIADYCGYNPTYLSRKFKKVFGMNLSKYILGEKMNVAANYLESSDKTLSEISESLCFSSQSHFQNTFKMVYRITPTQYRKKKMKSL